MKKLIFLALSIGLVASSRAQLFSPESFGGAALGAISGAIIGGSTGHHAGEGAAIGAGAGFLLGSLVHYDRQERGYYPASYSYYGEPYYNSPYYYRPNYALGGAAFGAATGALIGYGSGHHAGEGAAIGAGAGLLFGSIAESQARRRERAYATAAVPGYYQAAVQTTQTVPAPAQTAAPPRARTVVREQPASPMSGANRLFGR
jgi:uncharacterized protein YcfJ